MVDPLKVLFALMLASILGCATSSTLRKQPDPTKYGPAPESTRPTETIPGSGDFVGPLPSASPPLQVFGPTQVQLRPAILVFGPGGAKALGAAGVLKVLKQEKIPIHAIVGTELGGAVSALFAVDASVNAMDWRLKKIDWKEFETERGWKAKLPKTLQNTLGGREPSGFVKNLESWTGEKKLNELKIPLAIAATDSKGKTRVFYNQDATGAVRAGLGRKEWIASHRLEGETWLCSCDSEPFPVREILNQWSGYPVIAVNFGDAKIASHQYARDLAEATVVIRPELSEFDQNDYSKQNEIILQSEIKTRAKIREIRLAVGLPELGK